jgi:putative iron-dependent peroxidase
VGSTVWSTTTSGVASVSGNQRRPAAGNRYSGRFAVSHSRKAHGPLFRAGKANHGKARRFGLRGREVHGFRYFDDRDLIGFVDGTENPTAQAAIDAAYIGSEDVLFAGGSYVMVQKYLHDLAGWNALSTEAQERIIGRTKLSNIELDESIKPTSAHNALTTIVEDGKEMKIIRDNMPFGRVGDKEFGTYFIGYARSPRTLEQMLENMFVGRPPGNYDRLLDFSFAKTGNLFFVPSATFLQNVGNGA